MTEPHGWADTLADLDRRRQRTSAMGGPQRLAKQHSAGKLDARARLAHLLDPGSFHELGTLVGGETAADGIVVGSGSVNGSPVMVGAEDFTTLAGSIGPGGNAKRYRIAELALRDKIPLVMLLEGAGFRPTGEHYGRSPTDLLAQAQCSGRVPTVAAVLGPSAGHGALVAPVCDFRIMSRHGAIFTAGPPVVKESTGEDISKEELGGPEVALPSGVIHNLAGDDAAVLADIRHYLSYFPPSAWSYPSALPAGQSTQPRPTPELLDIVSRDNRRVYDMCAVLDVVFDSAAARRRADVRRPDRSYHGEAAPDAAQGLRVRVDGDVVARIRRPGGYFRLPGRHDGGDERRGAEQGIACRGGSDRAAA
jgi:acetyl-CoA carboxylase carboxyltransferase component